PANATLDHVLTSTNAWVSQADKPFPLTKDPVQFWARFDLPDVNQLRRVLLDTSPWEKVDFFFVRDGQLISHQRAGTLVPPAERSIQISMTPWFSHSVLLRSNYYPTHISPCSLILRPASSIGRYSGYAF